MFGWRPCLLCQFSQEDMAVTLQVAMVTHRLTLITPLRIGGASKESRRKPRPATTFCWRKGKKQTNKTTLLMRRSFSIRDGGNEVGLKMPRKCVFSTNNFDVGSDLDLSFVLFSPLHFSWTPSYFPSQWFFFSFLFLVLVMVSYFQHYLPPEYFFFLPSFLCKQIILKCIVRRRSALFFAVPSGGMSACDTLCTKMALRARDVLDKRKIVWEGRVFDRSSFPTHL